jgi:uncharacterized damage-inducible protein DinB
MTIDDDLRSLLAYNRWADETMLATVAQLSPEDYTREPVPGWASVRSSVVHAADAMDIWARRIDGENPARRRTDDEVPTLDDAARLLRAGHAAFDRLLDGLSPERLAAVWSHADIAGNVHRQPLWSVFRHVVNHATYHRGQVASKLKRLGIDPPSTDLIAWARRETPQQGG